MSVISSIRTHTHTGRSEEKKFSIGNKQKISMFSIHTAIIYSDLSILVLQTEIFTITYTHKYLPAEKLTRPLTVTASSNIFFIVQWNPLNKYMDNKYTRLSQFASSPKSKMQTRDDVTGQRVILKSQDSL